MKVKVKRKMATIDNWCLCATSKLMNTNAALDMITMEISENPNLKFDMVKIGETEVTITLRQLLVLENQVGKMVLL